MFSGSFFVFEALIAMILMTAFILSTGVLEMEDYSEAILVAQANDFVEYSVQNDFDVGLMKQALSSLGLKAKVIFDKKILFDQNPSNTIQLTRLVVVEGVVFKEALFVVGY